jgi:hypothetical protein
MESEAPAAPSPPMAADTLMAELYDAAMLRLMLMPSVTTRDVGNKVTIQPHTKQIKRKEKRIEASNHRLKEKEPKHVAVSVLVAVADFEVVPDLPEVLVGARIAKLASMRVDTTGAVNFSKLKKGEKHNRE